MRVFRLLILILSLSLSLKADLNEEIESILKQSANSKAFKNYVAKRSLKNLRKNTKQKRTLAYEFTAILIWRRIFSLE